MPAMAWQYEVAERDHDIQNPTSPEKIRRVGEHLRLDESSHVLDIACGKGGPAIILAREFGCHVDGVELRPGFAGEARRRVAECGLDDRVSIETADARGYVARREYDAALCIGAAFVWGHIGDAAAALKALVRPGGFVVVGEPFWRRWPLPGRLRALEWVDLPATVVRFERPGLQLVGLVASSDDDWDHYESLHWRAIAEWLSERPDDAEAAELRAQDRHFRSEYLRRRGLLGWAMFAGVQNSAAR
jgi:SAM-dependent methyltransferase